MVWAKITLPTCGLKSITYPWYVFVNLCNPPQAQPLQKHLLTQKYNITRIKTPKTHKLFERERHVVRSTCSLWFGVFGGGENTSFATSKLGKVVSVKKIKVFVFVLDLGYQILFRCQNKKK